jgi:hypothetical protein
MADDTYSRGYRNDRHDRGGGGDSGPATDPLTELARLIGQSDPFAPDRKRQPEQHPQQYEQPHDDRYGAASEPPQYADPSHGSAEGYAGHHNGYAYPQAGQHEAGYGEPAGYEQHRYHQDQQAYPSDQAYQDQQAYHQDEQAYHHQQQAYYQDPQAYARSEPQPYGAPAHGAHGEEGGEGALGSYDDAPANPAYPTPPPFFGDANYDEAPAPRRGWLVTAAALVGLAVVGTAGAFAYRAVFTGGPTKIITRDVGPSKITPAQTSQDNSAPKPSDRVAAIGQNERLGPPPEQPMPIPEPPRTVPPALGQTQPQAPAQVPSQVMPTPPGAAIPPMDPAGPPRIVRTERIKPNEQQPDASTPRPPSPTRGDRQVAVQPPQPRVAPPAPASNAPLSLAPQAVPDAPPAAPAPSPPPPSHTTALASTGPAATERSSAGGSGYYVQVSAQKSEEEAKSSFHGIQARHATLLGGQQLFVRRKDLGAKGVFYGAQVGPLSHDAANKLCEGLKAAGQSCMVQRN